MITQNEFQEAKHGVDIGLTVPVPEVESIFKGTASYQDYSARLSNYQKEQNLHLTENEELSLVESFLPQSVVNAWASCMLHVSGGATAIMWVQYLSDSVAQLGLRYYAPNTDTRAEVIDEPQLEGVDKSDALRQLNEIGIKKGDKIRPNFDRTLTVRRLPPSSRMRVGFTLEGISPKATEIRIPAATIGPERLVCRLFPEDSTSQSTANINVGQSVIFTGACQQYSPRMSAGELHIDFKNSGSGQNEATIGCGNSPSTKAYNCYTVELLDAATRIAMKEHLTTDAFLVHSTSLAIDSTSLAAIFADTSRPRLVLRVEHPAGQSWNKLALVLSNVVLSARAGR